MKSTSVTDARVRKTQSRLRDALVSLIHEKSYDTITVTTLWRCRECDSTWTLASHAASSARRR